MRFSLIICLLGMMTLSAKVYSQSTTITLSLKDKTVKDILNDIENKSEFRFFYNDKFVDMDRVTSVVVENLNISEILTRLFSNTAITYHVLDNNLIVITPKIETLQQGIAVSGTITDDKGDLLPGVNVSIKGTLIGVSIQPVMMYAFIKIPYLCRDNKLRS